MFQTVCAGWLWKASVSAGASFLLQHLDLGNSSIDHHQVTAGGQALSAKTADHKTLCVGTCCCRNKKTKAWRGHYFSVNLSNRLFTAELPRTSSCYYYCSLHIIERLKIIQQTQSENLEHGPGNSGHCRKSPGAKSSTSVFSYCNRRSASNCKSFGWIWCSTTRNDFSRPYT